ncbi:unnamed protein product [Danaus chrysippus]|uniref:(African queen) hypothetical protein n=1 Tax=Danaus chrysippus TaxID=151541 RepID=A0A8J2R4V8_9NEOP|nr:unnamed protein product [Danaus chrysippus]
MDSPSMETIYQAISALYDNPNTSEKEKASLWLGDVQKSIHSWKIADQLLQQKKDVKSCYFAAQTMRSKVQHSLSELPQEAQISLRDSLISHLEGISSDVTPAILTQLSLALADLALQLTSWQNCEIDSSSLKLGENRREEIKQELRANSQIVSFFLKECINNSQSSHVALKIVKCMTSWIQAGAMNIQEVPQNAIIGFSLQVLKDHNSINILHDAASDCVCAILHCLENSNCDDDVKKLLFDSVASLEESYHMAVAQEEEEKAANYARVFTELAETFLHVIIINTANGSPHYAMRALELALTCVGHHDYEVAEITFNVWYCLAEEVYERDYQPFTDAFKPHIERLIEALARHCQYEPDLTQLPQEGDEFYEFRVKVMELIKDVVFIVGSSSVFRKMFGVLQADLPWEQTEAALFIMQAVGKNILPEEYEYVPKVVEAILSMPDTAHEAVRRTCLALLGELCEWVQRHPACLPACLDALVRALPRPALAPAAAAALQSICRACRSDAAQHYGQLLTVVRRADELQLPAPAAATLLRALAAAVGRLPPYRLAEAMSEATAVQLAGLVRLLDAPSTEVRKGTTADPMLWLDRLAALFRDVDVATPPSEPHPCLPAFKEAWPVVHRIMNKYVTEWRVMERSCRCVRFMVRCTGKHAVEMLDELSRALPVLYARCPHSCLLYLAAVITDTLADDRTATASALTRLLHDLLPRALTLLTAPNGLKDNPDTVDDLFRLCVRYLQRCPSALVGGGGGGEGGALVGVLQLAAAACSLDHRDANGTVMKFLLEVVRTANAARHKSEAERSPVQAAAVSAVQGLGESLTYSLLEAAALHLHAYMLGDVADVLLQLLAWQRAAHPSAEGDWLRASLLRLPRQPPAPTDIQCAQFHQYALRAEKCKEMTRLLRDFARLYR